MAARKRRTRIPKPKYLPEATAAAEAAGRVLVDHYGEQPWILQAMEVVRGGLQNAIPQLRNAAPAGNMESFQNGAGYVMPPRTAEEIKQDMAAQRAAKPEEFAATFEQEAAEQDSLFARLTQTIGLEPEETPDAGPEHRDDSSSVPWL